MTDGSRLANLIAKHVLDMTSKDEKEELLAWMAQSPDNLAFVKQYIRRHMMNALDSSLKMDGQAIRKKFEILKENTTAAPPGKIIPVVSMRRQLMVAAAIGAILVVILTLKWPQIGYHLLSPELITCSPPKAPENVVQHATLTFQDGKTVDMDSLPLGSIIDRDGWRMVKNRNRHLTYYPPSLGRAANAPSEVIFHTFSVPPRENWQLSLPDRSQAYLNASSNLVYPVQFPEIVDQQSLSLQGEALFDIVSNPNRPTVVFTKNGMIVVLGTLFTVRDYRQENSFSTTVIRGAIRMGTDKECTTIVAGQEAILDAGIDTLRITKEVNTDRAISWQTPFFNFTNRNCMQIMREIARWYGMEGVDFRGGIDTLKAGLMGFGQITKDIPLSSLLKDLENSRFHFSIIGRKIVVSASP